EPRTIALFRLMHQRHPDLAGKCYHAAEDVLVAGGEYEICLAYLGSPEEKFEAIRQLRQIQLEIAEENPLLTRPEAMVRFHAEESCVRKTRQLLQILTAGGRTQEADKIRQLAREVRATFTELGPDEGEDSP